MIITKFGHLDQAMQIPAGLGSTIAKVDHKTGRPTRGNQAKKSGSADEDQGGALAANQPSTPEESHRLAQDRSRDQAPVGQKGQGTTNINDKGDGGGTTTIAKEEVTWAEGETPDRRTQTVGKGSGTSLSAPIFSPTQTNTESPSAAMAAVIAGRGAAGRVGGVAGTGAVKAAGAAAPMGRNTARSTSAPTFRNNRVPGYKSHVQPTPEIPATTGARIISKIALFLGKEGGEAVLDLNPPQLGRLGVQLVIEGKDVSLHMHARTEAVSAFLEKNLEALRGAFLEQGLEVNNFNVTDSATGEDPASFARNTAREARNRNSGQSMTMASPDPEAMDTELAPNNINVFSGEAGATLDFFA